MISVFPNTTQAWPVWLLVCYGFRYFGVVGAKPAVGLVQKLLDMWSDMSRVARFLVLVVDHQRCSLVMVFQIFDYLG